MAEVMIPFGTLSGHTDAVTSVQIPGDDPTLTRLVSSSRDKSLMVWSLRPNPSLLATWPAAAHGRALRRLTGHSHFVSDVALSSDGRFALSASWDCDLRLWDLSSSAATAAPGRRFAGHTNDALSVSFSSDNRRAVSGSRDRTLRVWNALGECKYTVGATAADGGGAHSDWVSVVQFSPVEPVVVSGSWDSTVRLWDMNHGGGVRLLSVMAGHTGYVNAVAVSPDGSLCASGGRDGTAVLWELGEGTAIHRLAAGSVIHALCFCPAKYWLCAATEKSVMIWDLENKGLIQELFPGRHEVAPPPETPELAAEKEDGGENSKKSELKQFVPPPPPVTKNQRVYCTSMSWSVDGSTLFTGYTDGVIRVWSTRPSSYY